MKKILWLLLIILPLLGGCVSKSGGPQKITLPVAVHLAGQPQLSVFLAQGEHLSTAGRLQLTDVEILATDHWVSILSGQPLTVDAAELGSKQRFINRLSLPAGNYKRLRFTFAGKSGKIREQLLTPVLSLGKVDSACLFLVWDVRAAGQGGNDKTPVIRAQVKPLPLTTELAFISCPAINTVYILRTDNNRICGSWGVSGHPTYLSVSKELNELIVLAPARNKIKIIELSSGRLKDTINIPMMRKAACMTVDDDKRYAFLLDRQSDYLSRIDLTSGLLTKRTRIIEQPGFLAMADADTLVLSSELSQKVVFVGIDNLQISQTITDGGGPQGLLVNNGYLYIAEYKANNVARYNLNTGEIERHAVGLGPQRILASRDHIYITNNRSGTVSILLPGQTGVARNLRVGRQPGEMALSSSRGWLYIAQKEGLSVIDTTSQRLSAKVNLRADPFDIAIIQ